MKNLTVSLPDDVYRLARVKAAERDTSVSALVGELLRAMADDDEPRLRRLEEQERAIREQIASFRAADRLGREELYDREIS
ncbi:MAG TPA: hypothetical protein VKU89_06940 [Solirubrobacteraceae bacterium]|nr:hypothetical protein [Solirubrobacteraceae bacterium]